jgi:predicted peptidase
MFNLVWRPFRLQCMKKNINLPFGKYKHQYLVVSFAVLFCLLAVTPLNAQLSEKYKTYEEHYFDGLSYGLFKPVGYDPSKKYPLIIYLHGANDTTSRDNTFYHPDSQKKNPCFVISPKCKNANQGWGNTWRPTHTNATARTLKLADSLIKVYNIDVDRLYLYGISMGGFGVFSILHKEPGKFAAAFAVCGGSSPKAADKIKDTPLWIFHGEMDDVVPVYLSRDIYKEIIKLGGKKVLYTEYPGVKHNSWLNVARETRLPSWLFSQEKGKPMKAP